CAGTSAMELTAPLGIPGPRTLRHIAALTLVAFQVAIALTGNYAFSNLLPAGLCLTCLDDGWWRQVLRSAPGRAAEPGQARATAGRPNPTVRSEERRVGE